jgi:hypothetical protein
MTSQTEIAASKPVANGATASFICGLLSFTPAWILAAIPAIILGHQARRAIRVQPNALLGARRSLTGLILGYLSILVVPIAAIGLLVAVGMMTGYSTKNGSAKMTSDSLVTALNAYVAEYQQFPSTSKNNPVRDEELPNRQVADALTNVNAAGNPGKVLFFQGTPLSGGMLIDPWGNAYHFAIDRDGDGKVDIIGMSVNKPIIVWSDGVNGEDDRGTGDDVRSW